ncbi:MAG: acyltransferase family protein [Actinobacteria bacterium]|nr:acyltransferase family protein [Actinomycetota bacterium]
MTTTESVAETPPPDPQQSKNLPVADDRRDTDTKLFEPAAVKPKKASLPYFAGLDGLRGLGLIFVVTYHGGYVRTVPGAYLAVSMFFTLSGFLITTLILREQRQTGSVDIKRFFVHRFRRLMPAAYAGLFLAVAFGWWAANDTQLANLRGDLLSAQFYVANWNFVSSGQAYAELFNSPSPLLHFWSLAIEEQFYLVYPLVIFVCLRVFKMRVKTFGFFVAGLFLLSAALPHLVTMSPDRFYFGTDARGAELLAGVLLAVLLSNRSLAEPGWNEQQRRALSGVGLAAFAVTMFLWLTLPRESPFVFNSGLALYAIVSALLVLGCVVPGSLVGKILGIWVLRSLGKISYGVYVYHWIIFLWLSPERLPLPGLSLFAVRMAVTLAASIASYYLLEMPIRRGERPFGIRNWQAAIVAGVALVVLASVLGTRAPEIAKADDQLTIDLNLSRVSSSGPFVPPPTTLPSFPAPAPGTRAAKPPTPKTSQRPDRPLRMLLVGDSTAVSLADVLSKWGVKNQVFATVNGGVRGCGIVRGGQKLQLYQLKEVVLVDNPDNCDWEPRWRQQLEKVQPDLIVVSQSLWDTTEHTLDGDSTLRAPGDPAYDARLKSEYTALFDLLATAGVPILWLQQPPAQWGIGLSYQGQPFAASDPARINRLNQIVAAAGKKYPLFRVVPYDSFFRNWPGGIYDTALRVDGIHPTAASGGGGDIVAAWLGPELLWSYWDVWANQKPGG